MDANPTDDCCYVVIPARLHSTRLPRKLLLRETGKTLLQHTFEAAQAAKLPAGIVVGTDHVEIASEVRRFGGTVQMTSPKAASGTDRVSEVAERLSDAQIIVNLQGDEPELSGAAIDLSIRMLRDNPKAVMSTLATPIRDRQQLTDPSCVKVVIDNRGRALYFSRSWIPHAREWDESLIQSTPPAFFQHIGLYAYRREFLLHLAQMPPSMLEKLERLEQLRVLSAGYSIAVGIVQEAAAGIDTLADYRAFVERERQRTMGSNVA
jgi:3-deoxy-manno-octulosonate cytidylyltransferase (CMP-KDO synthetase)